MKNTATTGLKGLRFRMTETGPTYTVLSTDSTGVRYSWGSSKGDQFGRSTWNQFYRGFTSPGKFQALPYSGGGTAPERWSIAKVILGEAPHGTILQVSLNPCAEIPLGNYQDDNITKQYIKNYNEENNNTGVKVRRPGSTVSRGESNRGNSIQGKRSRAQLGLGYLSHTKVNS